MRSPRSGPLRHPIAATALVVILSACGDSAAITTAAHTTALPPTATAAPAVTTTTTSTTTTTPTTTTTTLPTTTTTTTTTLPPPVVGWEGAGVGAVAIEIEFDPPIAALDMRAAVRANLAAIGISTDDDAGAILRLDLEGSAVSRSYQSLGRCYSGARVSGTVTLNAPDHAAKEVRISWEYPAPKVIFSSNCETDPDYAPYEVAFATAFVPALPALWGEESAPALIAIIRADVRNSTEDLPLKAAAMDVFRGLDPDLLDPADINVCLRLTIDTVEYLVENGFTPHGADIAARRLLAEYSGTNFGISTMDDVDEWRDWLDTWTEEHTP
jgi:hypothetical protein